MGLKADLDEVVDAWPRWPWSLRALLILSFVLSSSSIASLSETIYRWKGFVLDAVNFYRAYYSIPLGRAAEIIFVGPKQPFFIDTITLVTLYTGGLARLVIDHAYPVFPTRKLFGLGLSVASFAAMYYDAGPELSRIGLSFAVAAYIVLIDWFACFERGPSRILGLVSMLGPVAFIGILGAVTAGLTRT